MAGLTLWLLRHAEVPGAAGRCYGQTDWPADAAATTRAALALAAALPLRPTPLWCSPLRRCQQLAQALRHPLLAPQGTDARLAEMHFGAWEGREWSALTPQDFAPWMAHFGHHRVGGHGESVNSLLARVDAALLDTRRLCAAQGHDQAVWVSHAGVARALQLLTQGVATVDHANQWPREAPGCGAWICVSVPPLQRS